MGSHLFQLRSDPIVGRQVLVAEDRAGRPNDFAGRESAKVSDEPIDDCPFCVGHEDWTPEPSLEVSDSTGSWQVRVVPNKYPAVALDEQLFALSDTSALGAVPQAPLGGHEVIIESPRHVQDITELTSDEFARVLRVYRQRLSDWSADKRICYVSIFKNVGNAAGASLGHMHSQLVALPQVPPVMAAELAACERHYAEHGCCIFCQLIKEELTHRQRLVVENDSFVAFCAYAGRQPYETWILPREHQASYEHLGDAAVEELAELLQQLVARLSTLLNPLSYNLILHTVPFGAASADLFHWHFELVPRSTQLAGFEWGTGLHINPLSPERAATNLVASGQ